MKLGVGSNSSLRRIAVWSLRAGDFEGPIYMVTIGATLVLSWAVTIWLGGAGTVAPHWFYIPILLTAYRFGAAPTLLVSIASGFIAGPPIPDHYANGLAFPQVTSDWVSRLIDFVVLGQFMALLFRRLRQQRDAARAALYDPLTRLPNRVLFEQMLSEAIARREPNGGVVGVLFLDLDDFKAVNDARGHSAGDELLVALSARLQHSLRPNESLGRLAGDEFGMIVSGSDESEIRNAAERILEASRDPHLISSGAVTVHVSIGLAEVTDETRTATEILHRADVAMYAAKRAGKDRYDVFDPGFAPAESDTGSAGLLDPN